MPEIGSRFPPVSTTCERAALGMVRDAHSWADLTDDQLQLLRKATLAEISRRQSAAGDEGPVVVGASRVVGEIDHVCCTEPPPVIVPVAVPSLLMAHVYISPSIEAHE